MFCLPVLHTEIGIDYKYSCPLADSIFATVLMDATISLYVAWYSFYQTLGTPFKNCLQYLCPHLWLSMHKACVSFSSTHILHSHVQFYLAT